MCAALLAVPLVGCGDDGSAVTATVTATMPSTSLPTTLTSGVSASEGTTTDTPTTTETSNGSNSGTQSTTDGTDSEGTATSPTEPGTVSATTTDSSTTMMVDTVSTTDDTTTNTTGDPQCQQLECSDDLQSVECLGVPVEVCAPGSYCVDGACTPMTPCEAAELLKGSEGCDFWSVKTELIAEASGTCFAAFVANTWNEPVHIEVEYDGQQLPVANFARIPQGQGANIVYSPYDAMAGLPVGEVAILFLSRGPGSFPNCPVPGGGLPVETQVVGTGRGNAFNIRTDRPVAAYQMLPYGGGSVAATSATLLLPTSVWDTNYIAVNAYQKSAVVSDGNPLVALVADEDGTEVTIDPKVAVVGGNGVQGGPAGTPITYTLNRGETIQLQQVQELTGSAVAANKRIGMFGGASCLSVPTGAYACDGAHQQIPPVKALGNEYVAVRYRNRTGQEESPPWRMVGMVDGTQLTWTPSKPAGAPDTLSLGQVAEFNSSGGYTVKSQDVDHPFYLAAYMTGGENFNSIGDPEWVNVVPSAQYLDKYVFFTDPTYSETNLVVVRAQKDGVFADVNLSCAGALGGWQPLTDQYQFTRVDLVTGNFQDVGGCSNGRHEISSTNPFGVTVWGWGSPATQNFVTTYVSYAYPAGAALKAINDVEILPQ
ncbi:IgGFc-binding protein [Nannocystis sp. RBIL2]|uniref:IgGFc-binding protein n=1 Tax=Nannocystis sp. RBIL2 TaxID=2996788 RepID=UPI0022702A33|nr:IgGFc-binding protein [Nannocystis sp. RBIL2]MCY1066074.1 IgGFc-binding protein [Nannocystis sp. RBIL2]